jgi:mono/diheme cytochrome c family protein
MTRLHFEIFLGTILVLLTAIVIVVYGLNEEERMTRFARAQQAQAIEVGAALYENNCKDCHGLRGEGVLGLCPPLNDRHFFTDRLAEVGWSGTLEDYIVATISSGRLASTRPDQFAGQGHPAMPAWSEEFGGPLRADQIRYIANYVMNFEATALEQVILPELPTPVPPPEEQADPVARGRRVFLNAGCGGCHTIEGLTSGTAGPNLTNIGTVAATRVPGKSAEDYIHESILFPSAYIVEGFTDIMPKTFDELLSDQQIEDLVTFLLEQD